MALCPAKPERCPARGAVPEPLLSGLVPWPRWSVGARKPVLAARDKETGAPAGSRRDPGDVLDGPPSSISARPPIRREPSQGTDYWPHGCLDLTEAPDFSRVFATIAYSPSLSFWAAPRPPAAGEARGADPSASLPSIRCSKRSNHAPASARASRRVGVRSVAANCAACAPNRAAPICPTRSRRWQPWSEPTRPMFDRKAARSYVGE